MANLECAFCSVRDHEPERVIANDELRTITSFLSNPRLVRGHALVVPNRHIVDAAQLKGWEAVAAEREIDRLVGRMLVTLATGVDVWRKIRPSVTEGTGHKIDHIHWHVLPSQAGDERYDSALAWGDNQLWTPLSDDEQAEMVDLLRP